MLVNALIDLFKWVLTGLVYILPNVSALPTAIDDAINFIIPKYSSWNEYLPVDTLLTITLLILTIEFSILTFKSIDWIYTKIRG